MTKSTITIERLEKIKSWRETYGAGSNVMLPAEEAEALALIALAAMDSEPVAYMTYKGYLLHAGDPKLAEYSEPTTLYLHAQPAPVIPAVEIVAWRVWPEGAYSEGFIVEDTEDPAHKHGAVDALGRKWVSRPLFDIPQISLEVWGG